MSLALIRHHQAPEHQATLALPDQPFRLQIGDYGLLDSLRLSPHPRCVPSPGEVEIQVRAVGLNFRDVLNALGMLQKFLAKLGFEDASKIPFGGECAGTVVALGEGVEHLQVGDHVIAAQAVGCLGSHVNVSADFVVHKPASFTFSEAATVATAFLTADYGLRQLAKIQPGDRVLIHAATGGVGQAAVQIAQQAGAQVFATASPGKWETLKAMGIEQPMNSRTLDFANQIKTITQGQGVDVVFNSLNGDFIDKNLEILSSKGRFVEIGKIGIWSPEQMRETRPDVQYFPFDLLEISSNHPQQIAQTLKTLTHQLQQGDLVPLPHRGFPITAVVDAFRLMAQAKHIGKVVLTLPDSPKSAISIQPDVSYLITGGLGALGLELTQWLIDQGAQHIALVSRRSSVTVPASIQLRQKQGVDVQILSADVGDVASLSKAMQAIAAMPPLKGVIHAAGVLEDGLIMNQSWETFERVMTPKIAGSWNLHQATKHLSLDFFLGFSSIASLLGSPGQANYSAANAFMDALAPYRNRLGLPGTSINWGPWSEDGMAAKLSQQEQARLSQSGLSTIAPEQGLEVLETCLQLNLAQVAVLPIDWTQFRQQLPIDVNMAFLQDVITDHPGDSAPPQFFLKLQTVPADSRRDLLQHYIQQQLAKILGFKTPEVIEVDQSFTELGVDSLTGVELKSRLQIGLGFSIPITAAMDHPTIEALTDFLLQQLGKQLNSTDNAPATDRAPGETTSTAPTTNALELLSTPPQKHGSNHNGAGEVSHAKTSNDLDVNTLDWLQDIPEEHHQFSLTMEALLLKQQLAEGKEVGNPFFTPHEGIASNTTQIAGQTLINYSSYNYLGLCGDPTITQAAKDAIEQYGTSVSASRIVSGERPLHRRLEQEIAHFLGAEDCLAYIGGHSTNVSTIGHLFGNRDLILYDEYSHNSIRMGCQLSGATAIAFPHNDWQTLEEKLIALRRDYEKVLIVIEGIYSADGDISSAPHFVTLKHRYKTFLMIDEAHSIGVLGQHGQGIGEHFNLSPHDADLWMGTLSKSFASCGGYIAGSADLIEYLRYTSPGFVFSVGMSPANAASALAALQKLQQEPDRVAQLHQQSRLFLNLAQEKGMDTGTSDHSPVIPVIIGDPYQAVQLSQAMFARGINVQPMIYPSVAYDAARLRFFLSCTHTAEQIYKTINILAEEINHLADKAFTPGQNSH